MPKFSKDDLPDGKSQAEYLQTLSQKQPTVDTGIRSEKEHDKIPLLHYFAGEGKLAQVQAIIEYFRLGNGLKIRLDEDEDTASQKDLSFQEALDFADTSKNYKKTALHYASIKGHAEVVRALLQAGASRNVVNSAGNTPLHCAALSGYHAVAGELLSAGATPEFVSRPNSDENTALMLLLRDNKINSPRQAAASVLPQPGATSSDIKDGIKTARSILEFYKNHNMTLPDKKESETNNTLLHLATLNGYNPEITERIVSLKPELVNAINASKETPVMLAIKHTRDDEGILETLLIEATIVQLVDLNEYNALHLAVQHGKKNATRLLLVKDQNLVNTTNESEATPLHLAIRFAKDPAIIKMLLDHKADMNAKDDEGNTPLHLTALEGRKDIYDLLIEKGADSTIKNTVGDTVTALLVKSPFPAPKPDPIPAQVSTRVPRHPSVTRRRSGSGTNSIELAGGSPLPTRLSVAAPSSQGSNGSNVLAFASSDHTAPPSAPASSRSEASAGSNTSAAEHHALLQKQAAEQALALKEQQDRIKQRELEAALASDDRWTRTKARWQQLPLLVKSLIITAAIALLLSTIIAILIFCPPMGTPFTVAMTHFLKTLLAIPAKAMWVPPYAQAFAILLPEMIAGIGWSIGLLGYGAYLGLRKAYNAWFSPDQQVSVPPAVASEKPGFSYQNIVSSLEETKKAYVDPWYEDASEYLSSLFGGFSDWYTKKGTPSKDAASTYERIPTVEAGSQPPAESPTVTV